MKFIDEAIIAVQSGDGGSGCEVSDAKNLYPVAVRTVVMVARAGISFLKLPPEDEPFINFSFASILKPIMAPPEKANKRPGKTVKIL